MVLTTVTGGTDYSEHLGAQGGVGYSMDGTASPKRALFHISCSASEEFCPVSTFQRGPRGAPPDVEHVSKNDSIQKLFEYEVQYTLRIRCALDGDFPNLADFGASGIRSSTRG